MPEGGVGLGQHRQFLKVRNLYAKSLLKLSYRDLTGGFKCFRRTALETLDLSSIQSTNSITSRSGSPAYRLGLRYGGSHRLRRT